MGPGERSDEQQRSESELIEAARAGDERAFAQLLRPYRDRLWGVCLRVTVNRADAEDALQDALLAAWRGLGRFRGDAAIGTWLHRIASNAAVAVVRRRREDPQEVPEVADPASDFTTHIADRDRITAALAGLPEDFRVALVLREYGDFTYEQIAAHQGVLVQTVKSRLNRARTQLRAALSVD